MNVDFVNQITNTESSECEKFLWATSFFFSQGNRIIKLIKSLFDVAMFSKHCYYVIQKSRHNEQNYYLCFQISFFFSSSFSFSVTKIKFIEQLN